MLCEASRGLESVTEEKPERKSEQGGRPAHLTAHTRVLRQCLPPTKYNWRPQGPGDQVRESSSHLPEGSEFWDTELSKSRKGEKLWRQRENHQCNSTSTLYSQGHLRAAKAMQDGRPELTTPAPVSHLIQCLNCIPLFQESS